MAWNAKNITRIVKNYINIWNQHTILHNRRPALNPPQWRSLWMQVFTRLFTVDSGPLMCKCLFFTSWDLHFTSYSRDGVHTYVVILADVEETKAPPLAVAGRRARKAHRCQTSFVMHPVPLVRLMVVEAVILAANCQTRMVWIWINLYAFLVCFI